MGKTCEISTQFEHFTLRFYFTMCNRDSLLAQNYPYYAMHETTIASVTNEFCFRIYIMSCRVAKNK